ncbi:MAG: PIG-L family deacetylase [Acidobacteria bacterium]|nr:PIG-L family deacetylase [Acidobacteriota bacterium]
MRKIILIIVLLTASLANAFPWLTPRSLYAQRQPLATSQGIAAIAEALKDLTNPYGLACVATKLEDVDFATLDYCHHKLGAKVSIILATRNEADNDATPVAADEASGVRQTRKALQAAQAIGADVYFLNLRDFGFTDSAAEAFGNWGKDEATKKMLRAIRSLHPDVLISAYDGKTGDGQQQAVGRMLVAAFDAAADTKLATGADSEAWQARRLFLKTDANHAEVILNVNELDAICGRPFSAAAPFPVAPTNAVTPQANIFYRLALSASGEQMRVGASFFEGFTLPEKLRLSVAQPIIGGYPASELLTAPDKLLEGLTDKLLEKRAEGSVATLRERYGREFFRVLRFIETLERVMALTLGVRGELLIEDKRIAQGESVNAQFIFHNDSNNNLAMVFHTPEGLALPGQPLAFKTSAVFNVPPYSRVAQALHWQTTKATPVTEPYSLHLDAENFYPASALRLSDELLGNVLLAYAEVNLGRVTLTLPVAQRFAVAPPFEISVKPSAAFVKDWTAPRDVELTVRLRNHTRGAFKGALWVVPLALQSESYEPLPIHFVNEDEEVTVRLKLRLPIMKPPLSPEVLLELRRERPAAPEALASIKIPVQVMDCDTAENLKVGYVGESDSIMATALTVLGVEHVALSADEIGAGVHGTSNGEAVNQTCANLSRFDTIIIDALAYTRDANLRAKNRCLLAYARRGGNLVVFNQQPGFWSSIFNRQSFAPFAIKLSSEKITNKTGLFTQVKAEHLVLSKPNQITAKDFEGWPKIVACYPAQEWAQEYEALLEAKNADAQAPQGLLLFARYEDGSFVYTGLNLSAPLQEWNAGAYRLLANLISLPKTLKAQASK